MKGKAPSLTVLMGVPKGKDKPSEPPMADEEMPMMDEEESDPLLAATDAVLEAVAAKDRNALRDALRAFLDADADSSMDEEEMPPEPPMGGEESPF